MILAHSPGGQFKRLYLLCSNSFYPFLDLIHLTLIIQTKTVLVNIGDFQTYGIIFDKLITFFLKSHLWFLGSLLKMSVHPPAPHHLPPDTEGATLLVEPFSLLLHLLMFV